MFITKSAMKVILCSRGMVTADQMLEKSIEDNPVMIVSSF
jgi:hypothetical protein